LAAGSAHSDGKVVGTGDLKGLLHSVIRPGDRVALEGDNQKQADFLSRTLADCDPSRLHDLDMLISSVSRRPYPVTAELGHAVMSPGRVRQGRFEACRGESPSLVTGCETPDPAALPVYRHPMVQRAG
jgi:hypothetical protein